MPLLNNAEDDRQSPQEGTGGAAHVRLISSIAPDFLAAVSLGLVPGVTRVHSYGSNPDVDTGSLPESAWGSSGRYPWIPTARALQIRSTSAADNPAGAGAESVVISSLDSARVPNPQTVVLNGTTPVALPLNVFRINLARVASLGSAVAVDAVTSNIGDLIIEDVASPNTVRAIILAGIGQTRQAPYTVPTGFVLIVNQVFLDVLTPTGAVGQYARVSTWLKTLSGVVAMPVEFGNTSSTPYRHDSNPPVPIPAGTDLDLLIVNVSDNNTAITVAWNGLLCQL